MSNGLTQAVYIDSSNLRDRLRGSTYLQRESELVRTRLFSDINSPGYRTRTKSKSSNSNISSRQLAERIICKLVRPEEIIVSAARQHVIGANKATAESPQLSRLRHAYNYIKPNNKLQFVTAGLATLLILAGGYISFTAWQANKAVHSQAVKLTTEANKAESSGDGNSGTNALSTTKPSNNTLAAYAVAPNYPKYLKIPSIGVYAMVGQAGILANGDLGVPHNVYYTDWYTGSSLPGQPGATLIDGHVSSWTSKGVFYDLHRLQPGAAIEIVKGDNTIVNYQVVKVQAYSANNVDMQAAITPIDPSASGLNLITCTGQVIKGTSEFNQRIIVFAKQV